MKTSSPTLQSRLNQIKTKLYKLIELDKDFTTFGSKEAWGGHEYELYPTVDVERLKRFEENEEITFPEELMLYVTQIADGGAGPYYGLYSPPIGIEEGFDHGMKNLSADFPITNEQVKQYMAKNEARMEQEYETPGIETGAPLNGIAFLAEYGCGGYYFIVLNGEQHGTVWFYQEGLPKPVFSNGKQWTFFDWYENWLDEQLTRLESLKQ